MEKSDKLSRVSKSENEASLQKILDDMHYEILPPRTSTSQDFLFKVIVVGDSAVGKTALQRRQTSNEFVEDHEVTVGVEFGTLIVKIDDKTFKL